MAGYKLPPRQKMINLLYILLIAMLAISTTEDTRERDEQMAKQQQELQQLAEANEELARQLEAEKARQAEKKDTTTVAEEKKDSIQTLLINDQPIELIANGQLKEPVVIVTSSFANQLYSNFQNPLTINTIGIKADKLLMEMQNGTVQKGQKGWTAMPNANTGDVILKISHRNAGSTQQIGEYKFSVKPLPTPTPYICYSKGNVYKGNVPTKKASLLAATEIGASITEPEMDFKILSFETILIKQNGKQLWTAHANGNQFTAEQKKQIGQLEAGDTFYITSIMVAGPDGQKRQTPPINVIVIK